MNTTIMLALFTSAFALAWVPLALRFRRGWLNRRNPVSLAICAATLLFSYANALQCLELLGQTTPAFTAIATHVFEVIVLMNFYFAFWWSDAKFIDARREYTVPPMNTSSTPRQS